MRKGLTISDLALLGRVSAAGPTAPDQLAGLIRWYKADSYSLIDGDLIGGAGREWIDQSASGDDAFVEGGFEPTYHTNVFGAMPAIQFTTAGSKFLRHPNLLLSGNFTIINVGSSTSVNSLFAGNLNNGDTGIGTTGNNISFQTDINGAVSNAFSGAQNTVRMMSWRRTTGGNLHFREQNTSRGDFVDASGDALATFNTINFSALAVIGNVIHGEICVYDNSLSDFNLDSLYVSYFKPRWGTP